MSEGESLVTELKDEKLALLIACIVVTKHSLKRRRGKTYIKIFRSGEASRWQEPTVGLNCAHSVGPCTLQRAPK